MSGPVDGEEFAELALDLHDVPFEETVDRVLEFAVKALNCAYAGVILVHAGGGVETVSATHPFVAELDAIQSECGEGPDLEVIADRHRVLVRDTESDERWPHWSERMVAAGVRSMLGTRLYTTKTTIGSLNFYDHEPDRFDEADADVAHLLARHAAVAMQSARGTENLWKAIDARNLIGQGAGNPDGALQRRRRPGVRRAASLLAGEQRPAQRRRREADRHPAAARLSAVVSR